MEDITSLVEDVVAFEEEKAAFAETLRTENPDVNIDTVREPGLCHEVNAHSLDRCTAAGVDGGLKKRMLHGLDLVLTRAVAAVFTYKNGRLDAYTYLPDANPSPQTEVIRTPLERHDFEVSASLLRMQAEARQIQETLQKDIDILLLDGSIVPHYADKPGEDSRARPYYDELINTYQDIFAGVDTGTTTLAGIVEDSRGTHLCDVLQDAVNDTDNILPRCRDTDLLTTVLEKGERTPIMRYTAAADDHPTLTDLEPYGNNIYTFYLKTVARDRPIRIDFYAAENPVQTGEDIASQVYALSQHNAQYGVPAPVVEADTRASLSEQDLKLVEGKLRSRLDLSGLQTLRRENRPF